MSEETELAAAAVRAAIADAASGLVEREALVETVALAAVAGEHLLVIGPPDRGIRVRGKGWVTLENVDMIVEAQRQAALAAGCAFWDQRAKMGGKGSIREWVLAGMAQNDHVHLTVSGYRTIGDAVFRDLMNQYGAFVKVREALARADAGASADTFH